MSYECSDCGESFNTLSKKRLHDCPGEGLTVAETHSVPSDLPLARRSLPGTTVDIPPTYMTMEHASALDDDPALNRFFPILALGNPEEIPLWDVAVGYAKLSSDTHVLIGYDEQQSDWVTIEDRETPEFTYNEDELAYWLVEQNNVPREAVIGYDSSSPEYPDFE